jgi:hypothetical protein
VGPVRLTPTRVVLGIALGGSALYLLFALVNRDQRQVPLLVSGAVALGLAFAALAVMGAAETYRAATAGAAGRAFLVALAGGVAALVAFGCFSAALLLALVWETR